jgi:hypothetical protein
MKALFQKGLGPSALDAVMLRDTVNDLLVLCFQLASSFMNFRAILLATYNPICASRFTGF